MIAPHILYSLFQYDPTTGHIIWRNDRGKMKRGSRAGSLSRRDGYRRIVLDGSSYLEHRIIWCLMTGAWPDSRIDHRNMVRDDNRWDNLRPATHSQNLHNTSISQSNTSGFKGVNKSGEVWQARIAIDGKRRFLGNFETADAAADAYARASREMCGEFSVVA